MDELDRVGRYVVRAYRYSNDPPVGEMYFALRENAVDMALRGSKANGQLIYYVVDKGDSRNSLPFEVGYAQCGAFHWNKLIKQPYA